MIVFNKRKNIPATPKSYYWFFGILTLMLVIGVRYPVQVMADYEVNTLLYALITVGVGLTLIRFINRYHWQRKIVILMAVCFGFAGMVMALEFASIEPVDIESTCIVQNDGLFTVYNCQEYWMEREYLGLGNIPIVITTETRHYDPETYPFATYIWDWNQQR